MSTDTEPPLTPILRQSGSNRPILQRRFPQRKDPGNYDISVLILLELVISNNFDALCFIRPPCKFRELPLAAADLPYR